jgi:5-methylcytosine-specific restriction protein A
MRDPSPHHHLRRPACPCSTPGCRSLATSRGRCARHARQADRERGTFRERGYSSAWDHQAAAFKRLYPLCGMRPHGQTPVMSTCYAEGKRTPAYQVDHVIPHRGDRHLFWDAEHNWQSLCRSCGAAKSRAGL